MAINPFLRMQNLYSFGQPSQEGFGPVTQAPFGGNVDIAAQAASIPDNPYQQYMDMFQPENTYSQRLDELINQYPQEQKHTVKQKILASIMGIGPGGMQRADEVMHGDYRDQIQDWKNKVQPYEYLAGIEKSNNAQQRQLLTAAMANQFRYDNLGALTDYRNESLRLREFKIKHPNYHFEDVPGGNIVAFNPANPTERIDTGVASGRLSDKDKIELGIKGRKEIAGINNRAAMDRTVAAGAGLYTVTDPETGEETNEVYNPRGNQPPPQGEVHRVSTPGSDAYTSATQDYQRVYSRAREAYNSMPGGKTWLSFGTPGTKDFTLEEPHWWTSEQSKAERQAIHDYIYGNAGESDTPQPRPTPPAKPKPTVNTAPTAVGPKKVTGSPTQPKIEEWVMDPKTGKYVRKGGS